MMFTFPIIEPPDSMITEDAFIVKKVPFELLINAPPFWSVRLLYCSLEPFVTACIVFMTHKVVFVPSSQVSPETVLYASAVCPEKLNN